MLQWFNKTIATIYLKYILVIKNLKTIMKNYTEKCDRIY